MNTQHPVGNYCEFGRSTIMYRQPPNYDDYGYNEKGEKWEHHFCVMDDFGNAIPVDPFFYSEEGYKPYHAPDHDPSTPVGQPYKYIQYTPMIH